MFKVKQYFSLKTKMLNKSNIPTQIMFAFENSITAAVCFKLQMRSKRYNFNSASRNIAKYPVEYIDGSDKICERVTSSLR